MFRYLKRAALSAAFLGALVSSAFALVTNPKDIIPARMCSATQNLCYVRMTINFSDPLINGGVWAATLPKNAYILAIDADVTTQFNTGTLTMGVTKTGTEFMAASGANASVTLTSAAITHVTTAAGLGIVVTGNSTYQTQQDGAVPLYVRQVTAATAGSVTLVITYAKDNDQ